MKLFFPEALERYALQHTSPPSPLLDELERETRENLPDAQMLTGRVEGTFLRMLVRMSGARRVLEIGTYTGYSALMMAEALPDDGLLVTCEVSEKHAVIAEGYFRRSPHGGKIRLARGPALETLTSLEAGTFDFIFIDADKPRYPAYYETSLRLLRTGGILCADNVFWSGEVLKPEDEDSRGIAEFNAQVGRDDRAEKVMLSVRDGIYLIIKNEHGGSGNDGLHVYGKEVGT